MEDLVQGVVEGEVVGSFEGSGCSSLDGGYTMLVPDSILVGEVNLRHYQDSAIKAVYRRWKAKEKVTLLSIPTGGGKTIIIAGMVLTHCRGSFRAVDGKEGRAVILVHREELLNQALEKIAGMWPEASLGQISANKKEFDKQITVASVPTLVGHFDKLTEAMLSAGKINLVLTDEAHHAYAPQWRDIFAYFDRINGEDWWHVGVTATPMRTNPTESLLEIYPSIAYSLSIFDLIAQGYLTPFRGITIEVESLYNLDETVAASEEGDFDPAEMGEYLRSNEIFLFAVANGWKENAKGLKTIIFCSDVAAATALSVTMQKVLDVRTGVVHGGLGKKARKQILQDFSDGKLEVLLNCSVLIEGYDEESIECVVNATFTRSLGKFIQMLGRGLRLCEGKDECLFIDFSDNSEKQSYRKLADVLSYYGMQSSSLAAKKVKGEGSSGGKERKAKVVSETSINLEAIRNLLDFDSSDDLSNLGLSMSVSNVDDLVSLQSYPWFASHGIESTVFRDGFVVLIVPEEVMKGGLGKGACSDSEEEFYHCLVCDLNSDEPWFAQLDQGTASRSQARSVATTLLTVYGDEVSVSSSNPERMDCVSSDVVQQGYGLNKRIKESLGADFQFRLRATNQGVAKDVVALMRAIEVAFSKGDAKPREHAISYLRDAVLLDVGLSEDELLNASTEVELQVSGKGSHESELKVVAALLGRMNVPDVLDFYIKSSIDYAEPKEFMLALNGKKTVVADGVGTERGYILTRQSTSQNDLPMTARQKGYFASKIASAFSLSHIVSRVVVLDDEGVLRRSAKLAVEKQKKLASVLQKTKEMRG